MTTPQKILQDDQLDQLLLEKGYVIVPFLDEKTVQELKNFYYDNHSEQLEGMYATAHVSDIDFRVKMNAYIQEKFQASIDKYFHDCNPLGGSYIAKGSGDKGSLVPHQDWNIVDERKYRSFNIWTPLVDVNSSNGTLLIESGSHLWGFNYRSASIPFAYPEKENDLWQSMLPLEMKAGEALIYDHRLIHASGVNNSDEIRLVCVYGIIPNGAQMYYYHKNENEDIEVYGSNPDFFLYGNIFEGPKGLKKVKTITVQKKNDYSFIKKIWKKISWK